MNLKVYKNVLSANEEWAARTRAFLAEKRAVMWNIIGSPGSGKTALLERLIPFLRERLSCFVLEGDVETTRDADRLLALHIPAVQILTHGACHLGAKTVFQALEDLPLPEAGEGVCVFVENVGNLVCPAEFDIGENGKIAVLSVTEGEDKPLKYPLLFREAIAAVIAKTDLIPHLPVSLERYRDNISAVNAEVPVFECSAVSGEGTERFAEWLLGRRRSMPYTVNSRP
ncbi:MAG: hydrogenase nickel incorporation protein HypB [Spirochaetales bacterium]|nr:hydrogenase nickel incorporation protein HypB [Spirochaetales bacterium]